MARIGEARFAVKAVRRVTGEKVSEMSHSRKIVSPLVACAPQFIQMVRKLQLPGPRFSSGHIQKGWRRERA